MHRSARHWFDRATQILQSIGLQPCKHSPCLFKGTIIPNKPPLYLGLYVDDLIYFLTDDEAEKSFETKLPPPTSWEKSPIILASNYNGKLLLLLFLYTYLKKPSHQTWSMMPVLIIHHLHTNLHLSDLFILLIPFIPKTYLQNKKKYTKNNYNLLLVHYYGYHNLLALIYPSLLQSLLNTKRNPNQGHINAAKYVIRYLKGTANLGIAFHSHDDITLQTFLNIPNPNAKIKAVSDANWGPQDQLVPNPNSPDVDVLVSCSISGYISFLNDLVHWKAKRQPCTAHSTTESEILAIDECAKHILHLSNIINDLGLQQDLLNPPTTIYNDNMGSVQWSKKKRSRNIRHFQIRENATRESVHNKQITNKHIDGKLNPADIFTKEQKDTLHFITLRDIIMSKPFSPTNTPPTTTSNSNNNAYPQE